MNFKKKAIVTTLAAALAVTPLAGLPLSTQGALDKLGLSNVAMAASLNSTVNTELNNIHSNLATDDERSAVRAARDNLKTLGADLSDVNLVSDVWQLIQNKITLSGKSYPDLSDQKLLGLISSLGSVSYSSDGSTLSAYLHDPANFAFIQALADLAGLTGGLTVQDAADFAAALQTAYANQINDTAKITLAAASGTAQDFIRTITKSALVEVMQNSSLKLSQVLTNLNADFDYSPVADALTSTLNKIGDRVDASHNARIALALAVVRSHSAVSLLGNSDGRTGDFQFTVLGKAMPISTYTVEVKGTDILKRDESNDNKSKNTFTLNNTSTNSVTTGVVIRLVLPGSALDGKILSKTDQQVTLTVKSTPGGSVGGGGGIGIPDTVKPIVDAAKTVGSAISDLAKAKDQAKDATAAERAKIIADMKATVAAAVAEIAHLDLSAAIKVDGDTATVAPNTAELVQQIKDIMAEVKKLNDALKDLDPTAKNIVPTITLDLGDTKANNAEVSLNKDILKAAKDAGIGKIEVKANGVGLAFGASNFSADTTISMSKEDAKVATDATNQKVAAPVYEFEVKSDGKTVASFNPPVELSFPVTDTTVDNELLTLVKLNNGTIINFGGKYDANTKSFIGKRSSLSPYTVIENKVTFSDVASVQDWAGLQIRVAAAKGIIDGRLKGQFDPNDSVTRAEFAKMIVTAFNLDGSSAKIKFSDVGASDWFATYVSSAVSAGIINGRTDDQFDPNGEITRAEMATMAARALVATGNFQYEKDVNAALKSFKDADDINSSLKDGVALAAKLGIVVGEEGSVFNPNDDSTRAQAAVVIYRLLNAQ
jgi:hypothetical protein